MPTHVVTKKMEGASQK